MRKEERSVASFHRDGVRRVGQRGYREAAAKAGTQFGKVAGRARGNHFDVTVLGVADPAAKVELRGFALHEPAKARRPVHDPG